MRYLFFILLIASCSYDREVAPVSTADTLLSDETIMLRDSLSASIDSLKLLRPEVNRIMRELKYFQQEKKTYEDRIPQMYAAIERPEQRDSKEVEDLKRKLAYANQQIATLQNQLASYRVKQNNNEQEVSAVIKEPELPGRDAIMVKLDGKSRDGDIPIPDNLTVYLIPYTKKVKKLMIYESSCDENEIKKFPGYRISKLYNGTYFFNDVMPGKYLVKICCYYGNFKLVDKDEGVQYITMQISPPLQ